MYNMNRHAQGGLVQLSQFFGKSITPMTNSTLNEKFGVATHNEISLPSDAVHRAQYWSIGNGGMYASAGTPVDGVLGISAWPHLTQHTALYSHVPFRLALKTNDLPTLEREKYRLRVSLNIGGQDYWAYYLRKIDLSTVNISAEKRTETNGVITAVPFTHVSADLTPAVPVSTTSVVVPSGDYIGAVARLPFNMTVEETTAFVEAINILYNGQTGKANISEVALCTGVDFNHTVGGVVYTEAAHVRIASSLSTMYPMHSMPSGIETFINVEAISSLMSFT